MRTLYVKNRLKITTLKITSLKFYYRIEIVRVTSTHGKYYVFLANELLCYPSFAYSRT